MIDIGNKTVYMGGAMPEGKGTSGSGLELLDILESFNLNFISGGVTPGEWATVYGPSPLLLPKAKANSLQYVKAFGGTEQSGTPTPDTPVDIVSNNGVLKYGAIGKNLFDPTKVLFGYYRNRETGEKTSANNNWMSSDDGYIPCLPNTTYTFVGTNKTDGTYSKYNTIYFFDSAKNYLGASPYEISQPTTGTTPNNCYYLQVRSNPLDNATPIQDAFAQFNWQLEQGSTVISYEPYQEGIYTDGAVETISIKDGNNILPANAQADVLYPVDIPSPATYIASANVNNGQQIAATETRFYDANKTYLDYWTLSEYQDGRMYKKIGLSSTVKYVSISKKPNYESTPVSQIKLEKGEVMTPYYNGGTATTEMLLKVGSYQDVQSILDGGVTRNVGVLVLDGTESWTQSAATNNLFYATIHNSSTDNMYIPISSHFQGVVASTGYAIMTDGQFKHGSNTNSWYFKNTDCANAVEFSQYLADQYAAGTPVIVIYPLATATTESVAGQPMATTEGDNIAEITQASLNNLTLEAKYKKTK